MKKLLTVVTSVLFLFAIAPAADVFLSDAQAKITKTNGGGQTPKGEANGIPSTNPAGKEPAGHNK